MRGLATSLAILVSAALPIAALASADPVGEPYQLVRALRKLQDKVAEGSESAHFDQRKFIEIIGERILSAEPDLWNDRRNIRAGILYVLSGGDPRVLKDAMTKFVLPEAYDSLWRGAIAYAEGRNGEASELLLGIDARNADPTLGAQIALVQAVLTVRRDPARSIRLLDDARLLAPGTLIEEAALRRQITLLAGTGDLDGFEARSLFYLRRYPKSLYASGFLHSFVRVLVTTPAYSTDRERVERLRSRLDGLESDIKRDAYLAIAEEAIVRGKVELTRLAARRATELVNEGSVASLRVQVYDAAAMIVTEEFDRGIEILRRLDRSRLDERDASLLDSALAMADQVRRPPTDQELAPVPPSQVRLRAQRAISQVDDFLPR